MAEPDFEIVDKTVGYDGYFKIVVLHLRYRLFAGGWGPVVRREIFERGHAAAVLPYDPDMDAVVLLEQFRPGAIDDPRGAWLIEPVAGIIEPGEEAETVARREAVEEAGIEVGDLDFVTDVLVSPGGTSECVRVYIGRVSAEGAGGLHGLDDEGEDIRVHVVPFAEAMRWLEEGRIRVTTGVVGMQALALRRENLRARWCRSATA